MRSRRGVVGDRAALLDKKGAGSTAMSWGPVTARAGQNGGPARSDREWRVAKKFGSFSGQEKSKRSGS